MAVELISGTPGAGKTTFAVSRRLAREVGREVELEAEACASFGFAPGTKLRRRLVVAGIRGLVLEHERLPHPLTGEHVSQAEIAKFNAMVKEIDPETGRLVETDTPVYQRLRGTPPLDVPALVQNWWLWCMPGDLICIDEAQILMERGTLGRELPYWLKALAVHRHYGVDFLLISQNPQQLDTKIRALVNPHTHVRSMMGLPVCTVYTWDHCSSTERITGSTKSVWRRKAADYRMFSSSVAHLKPPASGRSVFVVVPALLVAVGVGAWQFTERWREPAEAHAAAPAAAASAPRAGLPGIPPLPFPSASPGGFAGATPGTALRVGPAVKNREPFSGMGVHIAGEWHDGRVARRRFSISIDGRTVHSFPDLEVYRAGYSYRPLAPCTGVLVFNGLERPVRCDTPRQEVQRPAVPAFAASAPGV